MARIKNEYSLYARKLPNGIVYYYRCYDAYGRRLSERSTHCRSKTEARAYVEKLLKKGKLGEKLAPSLAAWTRERHFFEWAADDQTPACYYTQGRLARSSKDRPAVQRRYINDCKRQLDKYILPAFGSKRINEIQPGQLENWLFGLINSGLAPKTANNIAAAFRIVMSEAERLGVIPENPWRRVQPFSSDASAPRGSLSLDEAIRLMDPRTIGTVWAGHELYYLINLTAMLTAARQGELLALTDEDIFPDHLIISKSWNEKTHKIGPTKNKVRAPIAIPGFLYERLTGFVKWQGFVFSFDGGWTPAAGARVTIALREAMERIGISRQEQNDRGLCFHSWRRFANSYMRAAGLPDAMVRAQTRHITEGMTEHYTDWRAENFRPIVQVQNRLIEKLTGLDKLSGNKS